MEIVAAAGALIVGLSFASSQPVHGCKGLSCIRHLAGDVEEVTALGPHQFAGRYVAGGRWGKRELYLFDDATYIYCKSTDISPRLVADRGTWMIAAASVELRSLPETTGHPDIDHRYLVIRRSSHPEELLLIGDPNGVRQLEQITRDSEMKRARERFSKGTPDDRYAVLLAVALARQQTSPHEEDLKATLRDDDCP